MGKNIMKEVHSQNSNSASCVIEFTGNGMEIKGKCAQGLTETINIIFEESKRLGKEISAYNCISSKGLEKVVIGEIGNSTSTSLPFRRVCPHNQVQVPIHTHPSSGEAKFSTVDAQTMTERMNQGIDDDHCVAGEDETQCVFKVMIQKKINPT